MLIIREELTPIRLFFLLLVPTLSRGNADMLAITGISPGMQSLPRYRSLEMNALDSSLRWNDSMLVGLKAQIDPKCQNT